MFVQLALMAAQMYLGIITQKRPHKITFEEFLESNKGDETRPIPYIRGKWKTIPQRIYLGDFTAHAVERDSQWTDYLFFGVGLAALLDTITVAYQYHCGQVLALTWGPINRVSQVWVKDEGVAVVPTVDNAGGTLLLDHPDVFGGNQPPGQGGIYALCDVIPGTYTQGRNAYLYDLEGNIPALRGVAALVIRGESGYPMSGYFSAGTAELREWAVEVMAWPDVLGTGNARLPDDSFNRVHAIYEWATNSDFGAEYPVENIDLPAWLSAAETVYTEGNGFSGEINTGGNVGSVIAELKASIDAEVFEKPSVGLTIKLIRKDYSFPSLIVLNQSNLARRGDGVEEYTPGDYADSYNKVSLDYVNADNNYQPRPAVYEDPANYHIQRRAAPLSVNYPGVASAELAQKMVTRDGRAASQPWPPLTTNAGEVGRPLWPGDVFKFEWANPDIEKIFRVHARTPSAASDGEKNFRLVSTEDEYSTGLSTFGAPSGTGATDPTSGLALAPPSAEWDEVLYPPDGLKVTAAPNNAQGIITGGIIFGEHPGQYARIYVTEPGGTQTLSPLRLAPDSNDKDSFVWPVAQVGTYEFCVQTYSILGATNGVKVCASIEVDFTGASATGGGYLIPTIRFSGEGTVGGGTGSGGGYQIP